MAEVVGVVAAAFQFAEVALKSAKLAKRLHAQAQVSPTSGPGLQIQQLQTFRDIASAIAATWTGPEHDAIMEGILSRCASTTEMLLQRLERVNVAEGDDLVKRSRKAITSLWEAPDVQELFAQLQRDQLSLLTHQSFASQPQVTKHLLDGMKSFLDDRLKYTTVDGKEERELLHAMFVLDPRDVRAAMTSAKGERVEGTCTWIVETEAFRAWLEGADQTSNILLIQGGPGKGKSIMAIYLSHHLEILTAASKESELVICFFCDNRSATQNNVLDMFRCYIWQLCRLRPQLMRHGLAEMSARGGDPTRLLAPQDMAIETLWRILTSMIQDPEAGNVTCLLDGLDECDDASVDVILKKFGGLNQPGSSKLKLVVLSRPPQPHHHRWPTGTPLIRLDPDSDPQVHSDISRFIEHSVAQLAEAKNYPESLQARIREVLTEKANGTFLWAGFAAQDLWAKPTANVEETLQSLPVGLFAAYDATMRHLPEHHHLLAREMIRLVAFAHDPLEMDQVRSLLEPASLGPSGDGLEARINSCLEQCRHILTVADRDDQTVSRLYDAPVVNNTKTLRFVHHSAKDYFLRKTPDADAALEFFRLGEERVQHELLARRCMVVLELAAKRETSEHHQKAGAAYAACHWFYHLDLVGNAFTKRDTYSMGLNLLRQTSPVQSTWYGMLVSSYNMTYPRCDERVIRRINGNTSVLSQVYERGLRPHGWQLAIRLGLSHYARRYLEQMDGFTYSFTLRKDLKRGMGPLRCAVCYNQPDMLRIVLETVGSRAIRAEPYVYDEVVRRGDTADMLLLIQYGGGLNTSRPFSHPDGAAVLEGSLLHCTLYHGKFEMASALVDMGARPTLPDGQDEMPFQILTRSFDDEAARKNDVFDALFAKLLLVSRIPNLDQWTASLDKMRSLVIARGDFYLASRLLFDTTPTPGSPPQGTVERYKTPLSNFLLEAIRAFMPVVDWTDTHEYWWSWDRGVTYQRAPPTSVGHLNEEHKLAMDPTNWRRDMNKEEWVSDWETLVRRLWKEMPKEQRRDCLPLHHAAGIYNEEAEKDCLPPANYGEISLDLQEPGIWKKVAEPYQVVLPALLHVVWFLLRRGDVDEELRDAQGRLARDVFPYQLYVGNSRARGG